MSVRSLCSAVAAAALCSAASSPAAVIYTDLPTPRLLGPEIGSFGTVHPFDIDGDGTTDFNFGTTVGGGTTFFPEAANFIAYSPDPPPNLGGDVGPLPFGSIIGEAILMIDASLIWSERSGTVVLCQDVGCGGLFVGRDAYIGLRFERPDGTHFGYIHFVAESDSPYGYVHGWAWEAQPDTPIIAGSIPEPSTSLLILGGLLAAFGRRRRINQGIRRRSRCRTRDSLFAGAVLVRSLQGGNGFSMTFGKEMKRILALTLCVTLGVVGCKESKGTTTIAPEIAAEINRIQDENDYSAAEISDALERWIQMYAATKDLLEADEVYGSGSWTPERFAQLMIDSEKALNDVRHEDQMLAIYSLGHLSALNEERYEDIAKSLRGIIVRHYESIKDGSDDTGKAFIEKVRELSKNDLQLGRLLNKTTTGEQD